MTTPLESYKYLASILKYDPDTGIFTRTKTVSVNAAVGDVVGTDANGYLKVRALGLKVSLHRLAFFIMEGELPEYVDHINRDPSDNSWVNLRSCTNTENSRNAKISRNNTSGCAGVTWYKPSGKWFSRITVSGKRLFLGYFTNFDDAVKARKDAEATYFKEFAPCS